MAKFRLYRRGDAGMYYLQDNETGRQESLKTRRAEEARRVLNARNEAAAVPEVTRKIAAAYLWASDPAMKHRTWQTVMDEFSKRGGASTRERKARAMASKAFDPIRAKKFIETTSGDFLTVLERGTVSTNVFFAQDAQSRLRSRLAPEADSFQESMASDRLRQEKGDHVE